MKSMNKHMRKVDFEQSEKGEVTAVTSSNGPASSNGRAVTSGD